VRPSIADPATYSAVNLDGTTHLLNAAVAVGVEAFILASSSSVYGNNRKVPFAEADAVDYPISPYASTKKAAEVLAYPYCHLYGLPITCLRFFTVFGPRQRPDLAIARFLRAAARDEPIPMFGDGSASRDYTYIDDIIQGVRAAMGYTRETGGYHVFNLGGNEPVSLNEMIATVQRVVGKTLQIERHPQQPGDVNQTWADLTRVHAALGYAPTTSLEAGMTRQWQWLQHQPGVTP
jgi:UDP-glucuronate 4-epimerase